MQCFRSSEASLRGLRGRQLIWGVKNHGRKQGSVFLRSWLKSTIAQRPRVTSDPTSEAIRGHKLQIIVILPSLKDDHFFILQGPTSGRSRPRPQIRPPRPFEVVTKVNLEGLSDLRSDLPGHSDQNLKSVDFKGRLFLYASRVY